jgi:pyridoxal phosphate enzyme (YggS family)
MEFVEQNHYKDRLVVIRERIDLACRRTGRSPSEVRLIGVTKTISPVEISALLDAGVSEFGENRWQHAKDMLEMARAAEGTWHFIGHLQTNKVKYIVPKFSWIHSVDSVPLAESISARCLAVNRVLNCLVQVNVSGEQSKFGMSPDQVIPFIKRTLGLPGIQWRGLMTMAPKLEDAGQTRKLFRQLRELRVRAAEQLGLQDFDELSMGMSDDFEVAVEEGATMVRVGRQLMHAKIL